MSSQSIFDLLNLYISKKPIIQSPVFYSCELTEKTWVCREGLGSDKAFNFVVPEKAVKSTLEGRLATIPVVIR